MKFQNLFTYLAIAALCMVTTLNARVIVRRSPQTAAEINEAFCDALNTITSVSWVVSNAAFAKWCEDGTVGFKPPKPDERRK